MAPIVGKNIVDSVIELRPHSKSHFNSDVTEGRINSQP